MLNPIDFQLLPLMIDPIDDVIVADPQAAQADKIVGHIRKLMVDRLRGVFSEPDHPAKNPATDLRIESLKVGLGRGQH
jgi:hypothetical protein